MIWRVTTRIDTIRSSSHIWWYDNRVWKFHKYFFKLPSGWQIPYTLSISMDFFFVKILLIRITTIPSLYSSCIDNKSRARKITQVWNIFRNFLYIENLNNRPFNGVILVCLCMVWLLHTMCLLFTLFLQCQYDLIHIICDCVLHYIWKA